MAQFIRPGKITGGGAGHPRQQRFAELASETFLQGALLIVDGNGFANESGAITSAVGAVVLGFASEFAHNLTTSDTAEELNYGSVVNQSSAVLIPVGAPPSDGKIGVWIADDTTLFLANVRTAGSIDRALQTHIGEIFGLTKATVWEFDLNKTTTGAGAIATLIEIIDVATDGGQVLFRLNKTNQLFAR